MYIYNATTRIYYDIEEYLEALASDSGSTYHIVFVNSLDDIFTRAQKLSALRGRFAKGQEGSSLLNELALTVDEQDFFDEIMPQGAREVFRKVSAWGKNIDRAYRYNVKFGDPQESGSVDSVASEVITDSSKSFTIDELIGMKMVITSGSHTGEERNITDNTADTITVASAFSGDVTGADYAIFNQTEDCIVFLISQDLSWDLNMLQGLDDLITETLARYIVKQWYWTNRFQEDYLIENDIYNRNLSEIRSMLIQHITPQRNIGFFRDC